MRLSVHVIVLGLMCCAAVAGAAEFRNFNLPCLAPLLEQVDSEAPSSVNVAFLRGPTRAPELRDDIGMVRFPIATEAAEAAAFFNQGVALVHALANAEAERSFRQALAHDAENPMIFWGLAVANERRPGRARLFAQNAVRRVNARTTARERRWIDALGRFYGITRDGPAKLPPAAELTPEEVRERHGWRIRDLEAIVLDYPDDVEARAFLLRHLVLDEHRRGIRNTSHVAVDRLAAELAVHAPAHPSGHYRIFLWLRERPPQALPPAATSAHLAPGVADSWRYVAEAWRANGRHHEAVPFLDAALRVDHRHLRERLAMPGEAENLAANYAALIRTLGSMGRIDEALVWAERMVSLPRGLGPERAGPDLAREATSAIAEVLVGAEQGRRLLDLLDAGGMLAGESATVSERAARLYWKGIAHVSLGQADEAGAVAPQLAALAGEARTEAERGEIAALRDGLAAFLGLGGGKAPDELARELVPGVPEHVLAAALAEAGRRAEALALAKRGLEERRGELLATAAYCEHSFSAGELVPAMAAFDRKFREDAMRADEGLPVLARLAPLAERMQLPSQWKLPAAQREIPGLPAEPEQLGPLEWSPAPAAEWSLADHAGRAVSLADFKGRAVLLNFFLGVNCPYCVAQLNRFRPHLEAFREAGVSMVAISTDTEEALRERFGPAPEKNPEARALFPYPVVADPELALFKNYGVYDDFEAGPMHGTFLIGPVGGVLWSDVSHEPFNHPGLLVAEAGRLLRVHGQ